MRNTGRTVRSIVAISTLVGSITVAAQPAAAATDGRIYFLTTGSQQLVSVLPDGSDRQVSFTGGRYWANYRMALSPDGTKVVLGQFHGSRSGDADAARAIVVDAPDGGNQLVVAPPQESFYSSVAWNAAGTRILFTRAGGPNFSYHLSSVRLDGTGLKRIGHGQMIDAEMSPDGTQIAFRDGHERLGIMDANGDNQRLLVEEGRTFDPTWTPDSALVTFAWTRPTARNADIYTIAPDGSGRTRIAWTPKVWEGSPTWAPDGSRLAFEVFRDFRPHLRIMNADGSGRHTVTDDDDVLEPQWGP
jgi:Tol biopolymer transport system component